MRKYLSFLFVLAIINIQCTKSRTADNLHGNEIGSSDGVLYERIGKLQLLSREVSFSTNSPFLKQVKEFIYDEDNRCTKILIGTIDSSGVVPPVFTLSRTFTFFYNGINPLPYRVASVRTVFPNLITDFFYSYDSKGEKIQDSVRVLNQAGQPADRVINYENTKDLVISSPVLTNFPIFNNPFDTLYIEHRNIVKRATRIPTVNGDIFRIMEFEYDNKINPYNAINIYNSMYITNPSLGIGFNVPSETHYIGFNTNNIVATTSGSVKTIFNYEYDTFNYPIWLETYSETFPSLKRITYFTYIDK